MKRVVVVALLLLAAQFFLPVLLIRGRTPVVQEPPEMLHPTAGADGEQTVSLLTGGGTVEQMSLEEYLWGVVAAEMPASFEEEALKAQTVAARTYWASVSRDKHAPADICGDSGCCQAYISRQEAMANWGDAGVENAARITRAVAGTDGLILTYEGQPIQAAYFSSAPGRTADAVAVWGNAVPYLVSVPSPEGEEVPNWKAEARLTGEQFKALVTAQYPAADLSGPAEGWLCNFVTEDSGLVRQVSVGGVELTGGQLRKLLGLRSACFSVSVEGDSVVFQTTGYGHGVGMSQYGANALAKQGKGFREILSWYYTGVQVTQME